MAQNKIDNIIVRMYRIGTGDCFVLKFLSKDAEKFTMMIDCGACKGDSERFISFVKEIKAYVKNHIDLLVITHEHLDHVIGFSRAGEEFDKDLVIDNVWVAWTEDPTNKLAKQLREKYEKDVKAITTSVTKINDLINCENYKSARKEEYRGETINDENQNFLNGLVASLSLYYTEEERTLALAGDSEMKKAMNFVLKRIKEKTGESPFYCYPGKDLPKLKGLDGIKFYVLGPPEDEDLLKKAEIKDNIYKRNVNADDDHSFITAFIDSDENSESVSKPFSNDFIYKNKDEYIDKYIKGKNNQWRSIDIDWLTNAGRLAIRVEKLINNTSLVLAIQFEDSEKVLLFPGDAQSGNWKSWETETLNWKIKDGNKTKTITAKDLLAKTVFYKVGHHLSHNGTASISGLDLMTNEELVAFATLDLNVIFPIWKNTMPAKELLKQLIKRTKGRVFRIDEGLVDKFGAKEEREKMSKKEKKLFDESHVIDDRFIEYIIQG